MRSIALRTDGREITRANHGIQYHRRRPNFDKLGAAVLAFCMWPLIFWLVAFVAEQRGF